MRESRIRKAAKWLARLFYLFDLRLTRSILRLRGKQIYTLTGECLACGKCCEAPSIQINKFVWYMPIMRRLFVLWQAYINGFHLVRSERELYILVFKCSHYDPETRRCRSYRSRPGICVDYPLGLLDQPWPEFFPECGYQPVLLKTDSFSTVLDKTDLSDKQKEELKKKLFLKSRP